MHDNILSPNRSHGVGLGPGTSSGVPVQEEHLYGRYGAEGKPRTWASPTAPPAGKISTSAAGRATEEKRKTHEPAINSRSKRVKVIRGPAGCATELVIDDSVAKLLKLATAVQRKQHRENQKRYRQRQARQVLSVEAAAQNLREQIRMLARQRDLAAASSKYNVWNVTVEYFRLFRHGLPQGTKHNNNNKQLDFVRARMTEDVASNTGYGPEAVMKGWRFLQWFEDVEVELERLQKGVGGLLTSTTTTCMTINERTLCHVFGVLNNSERHRLLGQRIAVRGSTCFCWDNTSRRVSSVTTEGDLLTPMLRLLGSLATVSQVFEKMFVSPVSTAIEYRESHNGRTIVQHCLKWVYVFTLLVSC